MLIPRLIIAAPMSGSGKTTIVTALIAAFTARGMRVAPFKVGPDYIDPSYHTLAAGRASRNLDAWMLSPDSVRASFIHASLNADVALIEGVMGLFDGFSGRDDTGSTAQIARMLDAPVLLVLDASAMARSAAAIVQGMRDFDPRVRIAGVLLNRVGSAGHAQMVTDAIEEIGVPVIGYLLRDDELNLPERHLGLIPTLEPGRWRTWLNAARKKIESSVNLDRLLELARTAPELPLTDSNFFTPHSEVPRATIAVARDAAFNFLYEDNLDLLRAAGADIAFFSPLDDRALPNGTQAIYLCGGFPEIYARELAANADMRAEIRAAYQAGIPIYAECGGLMYLTEEIIDPENRLQSSPLSFRAKREISDHDKERFLVASFDSAQDAPRNDTLGSDKNSHHAMVGVLPGRSRMTGRLTLGYREARACADSWLLRAGETTRGHEFHYSIWENRPQDLSPAYELLPPETLTVSDPTNIFTDGARIGNVFASYVHLHFVARPELAMRIIQAALKGIE